MKRTLLSLPLLLVTALATGCSNSDIKVESDLGEESVVKESAVTTSQFDLVNATTYTERWLGKYQARLNKCYDSILSKSECDDLFNENYTGYQNDLETIKGMPEITIVKYRTIDTNVNGDKTASGYKYVSCIPDGETEERVKWAKLINSIDGVNAEPQKEIGNNLLNDGLVASSVQIKVCEKYGNI